jgi:hypothetical protein
LVMLLLVLMAGGAWWLYQSHQAQRSRAQSRGVTFH